MGWDVSAECCELIFFFFFFKSVIILQLHTILTNMQQCWIWQKITKIVFFNDHLAGSLYEASVRYQSTVTSQKTAELCAIGRNKVNCAQHGTFACQPTTHIDMFQSEQHLQSNGCWEPVMLIKLDDDVACQLSDAPRDDHLCDHLSPQTLHEDT